MAANTSRTGRRRVELMPLSPVNEPLVDEPLVDEPLADEPPAREPPPLPVEGQVLMFDVRETKQNS